MHVPRNPQVYKDGVTRPLNLDDAVERAWAERHAKGLLEEYGHAAGSSIRPGEYVPLTQRTAAFDDWLNNPRNTGRWTPDELQEMKGRMHEVDTTSLLEGRAPHTPGELSRYPVREAFKDFLEQQRPPPAPRPAPGPPPGSR